MMKKLVLCAALATCFYANNAEAGLGADVAKKVVEGVAVFIEGNAKLNPTKGSMAQMALANMSSVIEQQTDMIAVLKAGQKPAFGAPTKLSAQTSLALTLAPKISDFISTAGGLKAKAAQVSLEGVTKLIISNKAQIEKLSAKA